MYPILKECQRQGAYHHLVRELLFDEVKFQQYFRLTREQFAQVLHLVKRDLTKHYYNCSTTALSWGAGILPKSGRKWAPRAFCLGQGHSFCGRCTADTDKHRYMHRNHTSCQCWSRYRCRASVVSCWWIQKVRFLLAWFLLCRCRVGVVSVSGIWISSFRQKEQTDLAEEQERRLKKSGIKLTLTAPRFQID